MPRCLKLLPIPQEGPVPHFVEGTPGTVMVTPLAYTDLQTTAALHVTLLPHGLFPRLGRGYVRRWHRTFIDSPYAEALCVRSDDGAVAGFLLGSTDDSQYTADVLANDKAALATRGALALLCRPHLAQTFVRTRLHRYVRRLTRRPPPEPALAGNRPRVAVLHALITHPEHRGRGVGGALLRCFEDRVVQRRTSLIQLVTHEEDGASDFYRKLGWSETDRRPNKDGKMVIQMDKVLP
jgi:ribosomal protein S18 acetylase RimI-like enzyme